MLGKLVSLSAILVLFAAGTVQAQTQSDLPRCEVGAYFTSLHLPDIQEWPGGFGGRFGYNLFEYVALEGEFNYFPAHSPKTIGSGPSFPPQSAVEWFGESQALFGIKSGIRIDRFGFFGKAKPGFIHMTDRQNLQLLNNQNRTRFALELGGVFEYYLSRSIVLRVDMGETMVDFGGYKPIGDYQPRTHNWGFQAGGGLVFRF